LENISDKMKDTIIDFNNVSFSYGTQTEGCLKNINFKIRMGEFVLFTGVSGSGKTTIMRLINGLIPHFFEGNLSGQVKVLGRGIKTSSPGVLGRNVASIFQNPRNQFFTTNSTHEAAFACENYGIDRNEIIKRVEAAFSDFKAENLMNKDMFSLSSGEKQKIAIIAAKTLNPNIYVFDEPSANLDIRSIIQLKEFMKKLKEAGHTVVVSEHRLFYLTDLCDRCLIVNDGKIVKDIPRNDIKNMDNGGLEKCNLRTFDLHTIEFSLEQRASGNKEHADFEIDNVSFSYKSSLSILQKCSLKANYGDTVAIIGHNGEGKTTLGKIIAGLLRSETGQFFLDGKQIKQKELYKSVYFVMQDADYQLYSDSVMSELRLSGEVPGNIDDEEIENTMKLLNIFEFKDYHPQALSGGQKQRVTIAAAMTSNKRIIVFDEPTSGLDYSNMRAVAKAINTLREHKVLNFVISHDLEFLSKVATKAVFVEEGKINNTIRLTDNSDFKIIKNFLLQKEIENYA
jgi:hypothetical protein